MIIAFHFARSGTFDAMAVVVAGSLNMDVVAFAPRLPVPGETIVGSRVEFFPGGKGANQALAAAKAGAETRMIGRIGSDEFGAKLSAFLAESGVDVCQVIELQETETGTAVIFVGESGENSIVISNGANGKLTRTDVVNQCKPGDIAISQLEIPIETVEVFLRSAKENGATTVFNPAPFKPFEFLDAVDILIVNQSEFKMLSETDELDEMLANNNRDFWLIQTWGEQGVSATHKDHQIRIAGVAVNSVDATGAGDCFVGFLGAGLSNGKPLPEALEIANVAAALSTTSHGAGPSMPTFDQVFQFLAR